MSDDSKLGNKLFVRELLSGEKIEQCRKRKNYVDNYQSPKKTCRYCVNHYYDINNTSQRMTAVGICRIDMCPASLFASCKLCKTENIDLTIDQREEREEDV
jgi:hypothetical protein